MTLTEVDTQIAQWSDKQALIEENLRSFVLLPAFQRLAAGNAQIVDADLRAKASVAMDVFHGLRAQQEALSRTIDRAKSLRASLPRIMPSKQVMQEIDHLLNGKSIQMSSSPTPPQRRELLRDVEQAEWISITRLLEIMLDSFRFVRDTVLAIDVAANNQQRDAVERLAQAVEMMQQARQLHDRAKKLLAERELKVEGVRATLSVPCSDEELKALATWLGKLQAAVDRVDYSTAATGLSRWTEAAAQLLANDQSSADADEALLRDRRELRGLFESLVAKASNIGTAENHELVTLNQEIRKLLAQRPTPIPQVRELVARYQQSLV